MTRSCNFLSSAKWVVWEMSDNKCGSCGVREDTMLCLRQGYVFPLPPLSNLKIYLSFYQIHHRRGTAHLLRYIEQVQDYLLCVDTDSLIFVRRPGHPSLPTGNFLGHLISELKLGQFIRKFVSLGKKNKPFLSQYEISLLDFARPKSFGYQTNDLKTVCKIKGFTTQ